MGKESSDNLPFRQDFGTPMSSRLVSPAQESVYAEIQVNHSHSLLVSPLGEEVSPVKRVPVPKISSIQVCNINHSNLPKMRDPNTTEAAAFAMSSRKREGLARAKSMALMSIATKAVSSREPMSNSKSILSVAKHSSNPDLRLRGYATRPQRTMMSNARWNNVKTETLNNSLDLSNMFATNCLVDCGKTSQDFPGANSSLDLQEIFGKSFDKIDIENKKTGADSRRSLGDSASKLDERAALAPRRPVRLLSPIQKNRHCSTPELGCRLDKFERKQSRASMNGGWDDSENTERSLELSNVFLEVQREQNHISVVQDKSRGITRSNSSIDLLNVFGGSLHEMDTSLSKQTASGSTSNFRIPPSKVVQKSQSCNKINKYRSSPNLGYKRYVSPTSVMDLNSSLDDYSTGNALWSNRLESGKSAKSARPKNMFIQGMSTKADHGRRSQMPSPHSKVVHNRTSFEPLKSLDPLQSQRPASGLHKYSSTPELRRRDQDPRSGTFEITSSRHKMVNAHWKPSKANGRRNVFMSAMTPMTPPNSSRPSSRGVTRTNSSLDLSLVFGSSLGHIEGRFDS